MILGILNDVLVKVSVFIFLENFYFLNSEVDFDIPIRFGKRFLATRRDWLTWSSMS